MQGLPGDMLHHDRPGKHGPVHLMVDALRELAYYQPDEDDIEAICRAFMDRFQFFQRSHANRSDTRRLATALHAILSTQRLCRLCDISGAALLTRVDYSFKHLLQTYFGL